MSNDSNLIQRNGRGQEISDVSFLLSCLEYMFEATGETMDPEDMAIIARIRSEKG